KKKRSVLRQREQAYTEQVRVTGENKAQPSGTKSIRTQSHTISVSKAIQSFDYSQSLNKKKYLKILCFS
ncbi:unnamed protein product, partial [Arabidopsis halleri]